MSQENVEIVRQAVEVFQGDDPREVYKQGLAAPDAEWHPVQELRTYVGPEELVEFMGTWTEAFDDWTVGLTDMRDLGDRVLAFAHQEALGRGSGVRVEMDFALLFTLRDGLITDVRAFIDRAEALEAAGLSE